MQYSLFSVTLINSYILTNYLIPLAYFSIVNDKFYMLISQCIC